MAGLPHTKNTNTVVFLSASSTFKKDYISSLNAVEIGVSLCQSEPESESELQTASIISKNFVSRV